MTDDEFKLTIIDRLGKVEAKQDAILDSLKPDGPIIERVSKVEHRVENMEKGAVSTLVMMFLGVISFVGVWLWNKVTKTNGG